ncbi:MAG: hypothetical protein ABFD92_08305 [Planctomycetaceae bacterium]|nr:hypothetical protein [Planctomycetaceae bacterium]
MKSLIITKQTLCRLRGCGALMLLALGVLAAGGCGGSYNMVLGDQVAAAGKDVPVVVRLRRTDFIFINMSMEKQPLRFRLDSGPERVAFTDKQGYAGVSLPAPAKAGRYLLKVDLSDYEGEEVREQAHVYIWQESKPVLAVDLECLPRSGQGEHEAAKAVLAGFARTGHILYMTRAAVREQETAHARITSDGYPDGPVLLWQRQRWRLATSDSGMPTIEVEDRMISQLATLKTQFPKLRRGVCGSEAAALSIMEAGLDPAVVGKDVLIYNATYFPTWTDMQTQGLHDPVLR